MLVVLIGEGKMHKIILPQVPSGSYIINDKYDNANKRLLEIESKDGRWQITSDQMVKVLNPKYVDITNDKINITNFTEPFLRGVILNKYSIFELIIGDSNSLYTLCCLPVYEDNWMRLDIRHTQEITIGRNTLNQISYEDSLVANTHARIFLNNGRWMIENYDKKYGIFLNDNLVYNKPTFLFNGDTIFIMGLKIILMGNSIFVNNPAGKMHYDDKILKIDNIQEQKKINRDSDEDKYIELYSPKDYFYRAPRIINKINDEQITIAPPPSKKEDDHMPMFLTVGSTACMGIMSLVTVISTISGIVSGTSSLGDSILSLISALAMLICMLLIPLMTTKWEKNRDKKYEEKRQKKYSEYIDNMKKKFEKIKNKQRKILFENYATTEECTSIILNKDKRLWERIIQDPDFLSINLGVGNIPLNIDISYPEKEVFSMEEEDNLKNMLTDFTREVETLEDAPVTLSLTDEKIIAYIDKDEENINKFMQNFFIQLMAFQSYNDLKFVFLLGKDNLKKWDYVKMFPYVWNDLKDFRFFEDDIKCMEEISKYLEDEFAQRANEESNR